jgi:hypothetical protein
MLSKCGYRGLLVPSVDRQSLRGAAILTTKGPFNSAGTGYRQPE